MKSVKVLIADDDNVTRHLLRTIFLQSELEVVGEATNGEDAVAFCQTLQPNVLLLDLNMPRMNGLDALQTLRHDHPKLAVIMISSDATLSNVEEARALGVDNFIVKPFNAARVLAAITRSLKVAQ